MFHALTRTRAFTHEITLDESPSEPARTQISTAERKREKKEKQEEEKAAARHTLISETETADIRINDSPVATVRANKFIRFEARLRESEEVEVGRASRRRGRRGREG